MIATQRKFPWHLFRLENYGTGWKPEVANPSSGTVLFVDTGVAQQLVEHPKVLEAEPSFRGLTRIKGKLCMCFWPSDAVFANSVNQKFPRGGYLIDSHPKAGGLAKQIALDELADIGNVLHIKTSLPYVMKQARLHEKRNTQREMPPLTKWDKSIKSKNFFDIQD